MRPYSGASHERTDEQEDTLTPWNDETRAPLTRNPSSVEQVEARVELGSATAEAESEAGGGIVATIGAHE